jgi:hypothetical protein
MYLTCVQILALTAKLTQTVPMAPRTPGCQCPGRILRQLNPLHSRPFSLRSTTCSYTDVHMLFCSSCLRFHWTAYIHPVSSKVQLSGDAPIGRPRRESHVKHVKDKAERFDLGFQKYKGLVTFRGMENGFLQTRLVLRMNSSSSCSSLFNSPAVSRKAFGGYLVC